MKTWKIFESQDNKIHLSEYGVTSYKINGVVDQLKANGITALSDAGLTREISQAIFKKHFDFLFLPAVLVILQNKFFL